MELKRKEGKKKCVGHPPGTYLRKMIPKTTESPSDKESVSENLALDFPCSIGITEGMCSPIHIHPVPQLWISQRFPVQKKLPCLVLPGLTAYLTP